MTRKALAAAVAFSIFATVSGCSAAPNTLIDYLGQPLEDVPGITDDLYVLSLTQDVRLGELPRDANQVLPGEEGWIVSAICADTGSIDPAETKNLTVRVVAEEFVNGDTMTEIQAGSMQDGVVCGNATPLGAEVE